MPTRPPERRQPPYWLLRRADQAAVAALTALGLGAVVGWWVWQGGLQGRLIDIESPRSAPPAFHVDVNTADWPELAQLPGIGKTLAQRIVEVRHADGPFLDHDDLRRVRGIGPKTLEAIRPYLSPMPGRETVAGR
jgi:competence protein ComEA